MKYDAESFKEYKNRLKNRKIFSKYYDGIRLSPVMRYSVTKETIANIIAMRIKKKGYNNVVDACGGAGGNTIAFARQNMNVAYVDISEQNLEDAIHNCKIYDVFDSVYFHLGDIFDFNCLQDSGLDPQNTFFFASVEWGGPSYKKKEVFDLEDLNPSLSSILSYIKANNYPEAVLYAPRNSSMEQARKNCCVRYEYMYLDGWCDAVCLWFKFN